MNYFIAYAIEKEKSALLGTVFFKSKIYPSNKILEKYIIESVKVEPFKDIKILSITEMTDEQKKIYLGW